MALEFLQVFREQEKEMWQHSKQLWKENKQFKNQIEVINTALDFLERYLRLLKEPKEPPEPTRVTCPGCNNIIIIHPNAEQTSKQMREKMDQQALEMLMDLVAKKQSKTYHKQ